MNYMCWIAAISLLAAFALGLAVKWGWLEWLQVHAPNEFFSKLFNCKFCCSFHVSLIISLILSVGTGQWILLAAPMFTTVIVRELW